MGNRRDFLKKSIGLVSLSASAPLWLRSAVANAQGTSTARTLVVLQLGGGNDGLNTIVPYTSGPYHDARPTLGFAGSEILPIDGTLGFHPSMTALQGLFAAQKLAVVNGVGYPMPNRSRNTSTSLFAFGTFAPARSPSTLMK